MKYKKAIGAIVSISLLLVVATVSVVSFSSWFDSFQSNLQSKVETTSSGIESISIQRIEKLDSQLNVYVRNSNNKVVLLSGISINNQICEIFGTNLLLEEQVTILNIDGCNQFETGEDVEILIRTQNGLFTEKRILR